MSRNLILATRGGAAVLEHDGAEWRAIAESPTPSPATSVAGAGGTLMVGTTGGLFRSEDRGRTWQSASEGLTVPHVRWLAFHPTHAGRAYAGTEPAAVFVSVGDGRTWRERRDVAELRDAHGWSLPYSPAAGCIRGFAFHGERGYAAAEVGGALRSDDGGTSWRLLEGGVHPDVHSVEVHPSSPDLVFAATGGGLYRSRDGGQEWECLYRCYCRAVWLDPADPDHLILGPAAFVDREGRIEESHDGGRSWRDAGEGQETPWRRHMVERFAQAGDELLAVLSNGELLAAPLQSLTWRRIVPEAGRVSAVAVLEGEGAG